MVKLTEKIFKFASLSFLYAKILEIYFSVFKNPDGYIVNNFGFRAGDFSKKDEAGFKVNGSQKVTCPASADD